MQKLSPKIQSGDDIYQQKIESTDDKCKLKVTNLETDSKGAQTEMVYEFILSDIDAGKTEISISGKTCGVELVTKDNQKLIKPYENGESGNFIYKLNIVTADVLEAKNIKEAMNAAIQACK